MQPINYNQISWLPQHLNIRCDDSWVPVEIIPIGETVLCYDGNKHFSANVTRVLKRPKVDKESFLYLSVPGESILLHKSNQLFTGEDSKKVSELKTIKLGTEIVDVNLSNQKVFGQNLSVRSELYSLGVGKECYLVVNQGSSYFYIKISA